MKIKLILLSFVFLAQTVYCQHVVEKAQPTHWWVGMKNPSLQIMFYGKNIATKALKLEKYKGVKLTSIKKTANPDFVFANLSIHSSAKAGTLLFKFGQDETFKYLLKQKTFQPNHVTAQDLIYLIMPDRFVNGNPKNDAFADMKDQAVDPKSLYLRHGGDFEGIVSKLDYLQDLGVTTLWLNPVIENDEKLMDEGGGRMQAGYHGYHFTDQYKIDKRFGGDEGYRALSAALKKRGMKLVQDAIYNHVSEDHWLFQNPPAEDWFNKWPQLTITSHKEQSFMDPYGTDIDKKVLFDGWFTSFLPDINQRNPEMAKFLIQHAIYSIEEFGLDAWRIDTYKYNDMDFMNACNAAIESEYPGMLIFGETMVKSVPNLAYFTANHLNLPFQCNLPSSCDFPLMDAVLKALNEGPGWDEGVNRIYQVLAQDFLYKNPEKMVTFLDNHDTDRFYSVIGQDFNKYKLGITFLMTTRGIPQLYYGTEILTKNFRDPNDAAVRLNFPGGFAGDEKNKFEAKDRTDPENQAFDFTKSLATFRKNSEALTSGKLFQYTPKDNIYVYFRISDHQKIMCVWNSNTEAKTLDLQRFTENIGTDRGIKWVFSTGQIDPQATINTQAVTVPANSIQIYQLTK